MAKAKTQQKRWHLDGEGYGVSEEKKTPSTYLGNYNVSNMPNFALVAYTGSYYDLIDYPDLSNFVVDGNYVHTDNNYTDEEKAKLASLENYVLPVATEKILGGIKVGDHLEMRADPKDKNGVKDRLSVIESHFIYVQDARAVGRYDDIPTNSAGQISLTAGYSPTGEAISGYYIRYNNMVFFSQDPMLNTKTVNTKTGKFEQDYLRQGGLWWTTRTATQWIKTLDQFNILSFNNRIGHVVPVGMDDYKINAEDYTADMVGAMARRAYGGSYDLEKRFWNGVGLDGLEQNSEGWAKLGHYDPDEPNRYDYVNSPFGRPTNGNYWRLDGLPTLPEHKVGKKMYPATYRGSGDHVVFFMPSGTERIWVKSTTNYKTEKWFYLEQLPIATRSRLGGVIIGDGLDITESGVLSVSGIVTSWTGQQGARRVNDVHAMAGDYTAEMVTFGNNGTVAGELSRLLSLINTKANINSPAFTGVPTTPTPSQTALNNQQIVNVEWVRTYTQNAIQNIVGYKLPIASATTLGGIKVGNGLTIDGSGVLSVNIQGSGGSNIVVDTALSTTSDNPIANETITNYVYGLNSQFANYVLINNGSANNLSLSGNSTSITLPAGTSNDRIATTAFVTTAINNAITSINGGVQITPYTLPVATGSTLGGVKVTGSDGIKIVDSGTDEGRISLDLDYLDNNLNFISSDNVIGKSNSYQTWADIPENSSGYVFLDAAYSPTSQKTSGYYLKYNYSPTSYLLWFCDAVNNDVYYLIHISDDQCGWTKTMSITQDSDTGMFDIDFDKFVKIENNNVDMSSVGSVYVPTVVYDGGNGDSKAASTAFVITAINWKLQNLPVATTNSTGVMSVGTGLKVTSAGHVSNDGVLSFNGRGQGQGVVPQADDYSASMISFGYSFKGTTYKYVHTALEYLFENKAQLNSPSFTGTPTIGSLPIATQSYVNTQIENYKPVATASDLGMIKIGDGLSIDSDGRLSTSGAVTTWTGNQGNTRTGDVKAKDGDYDANMVYYTSDGNKTVKSELDLKAYDDDVIHKDLDTVTSWRTAPSYSAGMYKIGYDYRYNGAYIKLPYTTGSYDAALIIKSDTPSGSENDATMNVYVAGEYYKSYSGASSSYGKVWGNEVRLLTTRDLYSPAFTGTPTINGEKIQIEKVGGTDIGSVKNGGNIVINSDGEMNYTLPTASGTVLGGVKIGNGISIDSDGRISTSGSVTNFGPSGNKRTGDITPEAGDYDASQIAYNTTKTVKDVLDTISSGVVNSFNSRTGNVVPAGNEEDYTADMVGAIAKKISLTVSSLENIPVGSAGSLIYTSPYSNPSSITGGYICLPITAETGNKICNRIVIVSKNTSFDNAASRFGDLCFSVRWTYTSGSSPRSVWSPWQTLRGIDRYINKTKAVILNRNFIYLTSDEKGYERITDAKIRDFENSMGVALTSAAPVSGDYIATYIDITDDRFLRYTSGAYNSGSYYSAPHKLTISIFDSTSDEQLQGLYYARTVVEEKAATSQTQSTGGNGKWIKLIDSDNITDYIQDTSTFYNTENYTTAEVSAAIAADLAELNPST